MAFGMGELRLKNWRSPVNLTGKSRSEPPVAGIVLARNVFPGLRFDRNTELYRIADLSRVWILADVYENEADYFKPGIQAKVTLAHQQKTFQARVSKVLPLFDPATRTLKVRMELDNPGYALRPDMFVDVEFPIQLPSPSRFPWRRSSMPGSRRLFSSIAARDISSHGRWRPVGAWVTDRITRGLAAGERIVTLGDLSLRFRKPDGAGRSGNKRLVGPGPGFRAGGFHPQG